MPCCRIESISSCSALRAKSLRGCSVLGTMFARLIRCTLSPDSPVSARVAADGVPINAPSPLPRPDRAMRLRLREQFHQRKQQIRAVVRAIGKSWKAELPMSGRTLRILAVRPPSQAWSLISDGSAPPSQKVLKKCIDTERRNLVSRAPGSEID